MKKFADMLAENAMPGMPQKRPDAPAHSGGSDHPITWHEIQELEKHLDDIWKHLGIDIDFTKHFMERVNDPRNKKQITISELQKIFTEVAKKYGKMIASKVTPDSEKTFDSVLTDLSTKVNTPVIVHWDKKSKELKMNAKTVMRVNHFYTHDNQPRLTVQHFEPEKLMKQKTYTDLKEWIGFNTPEVAPMTTVQAVDDVDTTAFSVEKPDVLDKLNAYCHGIANHQYINPYYPLNALWRKLALVGINFDLKAIMLNGASGRVAVPLNLYGGRYGYVNPNPHDVNVISHDDGISHKIPGGLELVITHQKTGGVYTLTAEIQHGAHRIGFGEAVTEAEGDKSYGFTNNPHPYHDAATSHGYKAKQSGTNVHNGGGKTETHTYKHPDGHTLHLYKHVDRYHPGLNKKTWSEWDHKSSKGTKTSGQSQKELTATLTQKKK